MSMQKALVPQHAIIDAVERAAAAVGVVVPESLRHRPRKNMDVQPGSIDDIVNRLVRHGHEKARRGGGPDRFNAPKRRGDLKPYTPEEMLRGGFPFQFVAAPEDREMLETYAPEELRRWREAMVEHDSIYGIDPRLEHYPILARAYEDLKRAYERLKRERLEVEGL